MFQGNRILNNHQHFLLFSLLDLRLFYCPCEAVLLEMTDFVCHQCKFIISLKQGGPFSKMILKQNFGEDGICKKCGNRVKIYDKDFHAEGYSGMEMAPMGIRSYGQIKDDTERIRSIEKNRIIQWLKEGKDDFFMISALTDDYFKPISEKNPDTFTRSIQERHTITQTMVNVILITKDEYNGKPFAGYNERGFHGKGHGTEEGRKDYQRFFY